MVFKEIIYIFKKSKIQILNNSFTGEDQGMMDTKWTILQVLYYYVLCSGVIILWSKYMILYYYYYVYIPTAPESVYVVVVASAPLEKQKRSFDREPTDNLYGVHPTLWQNIIIMCARQSVFRGMNDDDSLLINPTRFLAAGDAHG